MFHIIHRNVYGQLGLINKLGSAEGECCIINKYVAYFVQQIVRTFDGRCDKIKQDDHFFAGHRHWDSM